IVYRRLWDQLMLMMMANPAWAEDLNRAQAANGTNAADGADEGQRATQGDSADSKRDLNGEGKHRRKKAQAGTNGHMDNGEATVPPVGVHAPARDDGRPEHKPSPPLKAEGERGIARGNGPCVTNGGRDTRNGAKGDTVSKRPADGQRREGRP